MNINIRYADFKDIEQISICNRINLPVSYTADDYLYFLLTKHKYIIYIAEKGNIIVGYVLGKINSSNIHILSIAVNEKDRGNGIGTQLINRLKRSGIKDITLYVYTENTDAIKFYKNNGFSTIDVSKGYYKGVFDDDCCDAYKMSLIIN